MGVVSTAIAPPRHVRTFVERGRLAELLDSVDESRVTTVCAPAGYGKTTAMVYWSEKLALRGRPILWLALRVGISNLSDFIAALQAAAWKAGLDWGDDAGADTDQLMSRLAAERTHRPLIVIDDAQLLSAEMYGFISRMLAAGRDALTTIIASRSRSTVPVARLRSLGRLLEVSTADLRFSIGDAARFVAMNDGRAVDTSLLERLVDETKGWVAGIVMGGEMNRRAWLFIDQSESRSGNLKRVFEAYFDEEVMSLQPLEVRNFLVDTSVLDDLTPAACAAVTTRDDGGRMLEAVDEAGLFVEAAGPGSLRFRYHPLFREMVLRRLNNLDPNRAAELHRRASRYYAGAGQAVLAIDHAALSHDEPFLADQLDQLAETLTYTGYLWRIDELGSALPRALLAGRPRLLLALAWRRIRNLAYASAETLIAMAETAIDSARAEERLTELESTHLLHTIEHRRIMLLAARDDMPGLERRAEKLLAEFGDDQPYLSCALLAQLMVARRELYHFHDTLRLEAETRRALQRPGSDFASIALKASVAPTLLAQGKIDTAEIMLREAFALARAMKGEGSGLAALPALPLAELLYDCGHTEEAAQLVAAHLPGAREWGFVDQLAAGHIVRARLLASEGKITEALKGLDEAHLVSIECGLGRLRAVTVAEQVRILIREGRLEDAERAYAAGDLQQDTEPFPTLQSTRAQESVAIAWIRLETHNHRLSRARKVAKRWRDFVRRTGAIRSSVAFELLLAEIAVLAGERSEARRAVREAVTLAANCGWTRIFLDEGNSIGSLLAEAYEDGPALDSVPDKFAAHLVAAFYGAPEPVPLGDVGLDSKLVSRELEILTMVGGGLRNREIGDRLGLTEGTVKWYMQQIYDKLGVRRRPQAVMRARQLGVLA
jgi:LuxR family maltose regulon positive regulatory protein